MNLRDFRDVVQKAAVATSNVVQREWDREPGDGGQLSERARQRVRSMGQDMMAKMAISQSAQTLARWGARKLPNAGLGRLSRALANRPLMSAGAALFAFDAARDGLRFGRGQIDGAEFVERSAGNAAGLAGSAGGAVIGGVVGGLVLPVVGAPIGSFVGSIVVSIGAESTGRRFAQQVTKGI